MHSRNIVYRDLKPENIMVLENQNVKLVDFGFTKVIQSRTFTVCGTPEYMSPEIILKTGHSKGADIWAVGILLYECLVGDTPF